MKTYILDGSKIMNLETFLHEFGRVANLDSRLGHDLQSLDDCLFGGYGLETPCKIIWIDAAHSKKFLDYSCLADWCTSKIDNHDFLDEDGRSWLEDTRSSALNRKGMTMFDLIIDMIATVNSRSKGKIQIFLEFRD